MCCTTLVRNSTASRLRGEGGTRALAVSSSPHSTPTWMCSSSPDFYPTELHNQKGPGKHVPEQQCRAAALSRNERQDLLISSWAPARGIRWSCVKRGGEKSIGQASVVSKMPHLICLRRMMFPPKQGYQNLKNPTFYDFSHFSASFRLLFQQC